MILYTVLGITVIGYLISFLFALAYLRGGAESSLRNMMSVLFAAFVVHFGGGELWMFAGGNPLGDLGEILSFFVLCLVALFLFLHLRFDTAIIGAYVLPFVCLLTVGAIFLHHPATGIDPHLFRKGITALHAGSYVFGMAVFALTATLGAVYLVQDAKLKRKELSPVLYRLPSLGLLDELHHTSVKLGFALITVGLAFGAVGLYAATGSIIFLHPEYIFALVCWMIYFGLLLGRFRKIHTKYLAYLSIIAFALLLVLLILVGGNLTIHGSYAHSMGE